MALGRTAFESPETSMQPLASRSDEARGGTHIFDLPLALLSSILSRILDPVTATHVVCSCRLLRTVSKSVPYCFRVSYTKLDNEVRSEEVTQNKYSLTAIGTWTRRLLSSVRSQMPMTKVLDLSGCWIVDEDVAAVLADLRCLKCLILDRCQKLTSAVADALAVSVRSGPQALSLQRCFGLGPAAAGNLLAAAAAEGSQLQCVLLSHLDRLDLPRDPPLLEAQESDILEAINSVGTLNTGPGCGMLGFDGRRMLGFLSVGSGIRILALHNCGSLGAHELAAVGVTCPQLEFLLLGGSIEGLCLSRPGSSSSEAVTTAVSAIVKAIEFLRCLHVLEATFFPEAVVQGLREHVGKGVEVWDFCERRSVCTALSFLNGRWALGPVGQVRKNLCYCEASDGIEERAELVFLALRAAVNCSDLRRRTPLHVAANEGDTEMVQGLISMGASSGLRDSAGATALFNAAWYGHADISRLLLLSGADVLSRNRSGENPLYIAALRGHTSVVKVLLSHCKANNISWQSAEIYGDGWTPLMAAAVADRQDVAKVLLEAAGTCVSLECTNEECIVCKNGNIGQERETSLNKYKDTQGKDLHLDKMSITKASAQILDAQNRYGQTALHIAARRASVWFVSNLLHAGASLNIRDEYKKKPVDIAQNQKHTLVTNIIRQWELQLKKRSQLDDGLGNTAAREQLSCDDFSTSFSHTNSELASSKGPSKGGLRSGALKLVWRAKGKDGPHERV